MEAMAKYDFNASGEDELSFKKGDILKILSPEDDWYRVELRGNIGYAPKNYIEVNTPPWYREGFSRHDAEDFLINKELGFFIIRDSQSSPGDFSISVRHEEDVQHFKVMRDNKGNYYLWTEKFQSLNGLVAYYKTTSISRHQKQIFLRDGSRDEQERRVGSLDRMPVPRAAGPLSDRLSQPTPGRRHTEAEISRYVAAPHQDRRVASLDRMPLEIPRMHSPITERPLSSAARQRNMETESSGYVEAQPVERRTGVQEKRTQDGPRPFPGAGDESSMAPGYRRMPDLPAPNQMQRVQLVRALYDFDALEQDELGFHCDDLIEVLDSSDPSWWLGRFRGRDGLFPVNYVSVVKR